MKKNLFTLLLLLATVVTVQAQSLTGKTWLSDISSDDMPDTGLIITFDEDGTCAMGMVSVQSIDEETALTMDMTFVCPGIYILDGDQLSMMIDTSKAELEFDFDSETLDKPSLDLFTSMLRPEIEKEKPEMIKKFIEDLPAVSDFTVVSITDSELTLNDGETERTFVAIQE